MKKYLLPILLIAFWACEDEEDSTITICDANITWEIFYSSDNLSEYVGVQGTIENIGDKNITEIDYRWKVTFTDYTTSYIDVKTFLIDLPPNSNYSFITEAYDSARIYGKTVESVKLENSSEVECD